MKSILSALFFLLSFISATAQKTTNDSASNYRVVAAFSSICCGTAPDDFLKTFVKDFNKKNKVKVTGQKLGACGREGEYNVLFTLSKLKKSCVTKFISTLKTAVLNQNKKSAATNKGPVNLLYDKTATDLQGCRGTIEPWN